MKGHFSLREFIVDFFGALMPGVLFLVFLLLSFFTSVICTISILQCEVGNCYEMQSLLDGIKYFVLSVRSVGILAIFILFLGVGYAIGTLFYRRDPKYPDYRSFIKIVSKFSSAEELENWVVRVKHKNNTQIKNRLKQLRWHNRLYYWAFRLKKTKRLMSQEVKQDKKNSQANNEHGFIKNPKLINMLTVNESEVQYPYSNLAGFLIKRGRKDLADKVGWSIESEDSRSKTFINSLKIRLQFKHPERCGTIIKNEAHIRLSSSMWYASTALIKSSFTGLIILIGAIFFARLTYSQSLEFLFPIVINLVIVLLAYIAQKNSEKFLHYQRVREIFYVMETADAAYDIEKEDKKESEGNGENDEYGGYYF